MRTITIFGSSKPRPGQTAYDDAYALGTALASDGCTVCNGGYGGTMEAGAHGAYAAGGNTVGVTCTLFDAPPNEWMREVIHTPSLEERLRTLVTKGDGFVVLPGGTGTLLELAYVLESMNKGFIERRPVVLYGDFWTPALRPLREEMKDDRLGTLEDFLFVERSPEAVLGRLR